MTALRQIDNDLGHYNFHGSTGSDDYHRLRKSSSRHKCDPQFLHPYVYGSLTPFHSAPARSGTAPRSAPSSQVPSSSLCLSSVECLSCVLFTGNRLQGRRELKDILRNRPAKKAKCLKIQMQNLSVRSRTSTDSASTFAIWPAWPFRTRRMQTSPSLRRSTRGQRAGGSQMTLNLRRKSSASSSPRSCGASTNDRRVHLYFFGLPGRIKIGISRNLRERLIQVGAHMSRQPRLLGSILGSRDFEQHVHAQLAAFRLKGEWFEDCPEVRSVMQRVLAGDNLGFQPRNSPGETARRTPTEITPEEWLRRFRIFVAMRFPDDPAGGFAEMFDLSRDQVEKYLSGDEEVPFLLGSAWSGHFVSWMLNKHFEEKAARR